MTGLGLQGLGQGPGPSLAHHTSTPHQHTSTLHQHLAYTLFSSVLVLCAGVVWQEAWAPRPRPYRPSPPQSCHPHRTSTPAPSSCRTSTGTCSCLTSQISSMPMSLYNTVEGFSIICPRHCFGPSGPRYPPGSRPILLVKSRIVRRFPRDLRQIGPKPIRQFTLSGALPEKS